MEDSISGFKVRGTWEDVVEHGERVTEALRESGLDGTPEFEEWNEWRPKAHERLGEDVSEKTAEQASVGEGSGEAAGRSADEDFQTAGEKLSESYARLEDDDRDGALDNWQDSVDYVKRAADTASRRAIRRVEDAVYRRVMTRFTPYYFDNDLVSANIASTRDGEYVFEVNVNDDDLKAAARERLAAFETDVDRWHVDTEKETTTAAAVEGVEVPESGEDARSTTN
ncbi:MAG: DUF5828 family protein [Halobacteriaceae archaeon]